MKFSAAVLSASLASVAMASDFGAHIKIKCKGLENEDLSDEEKKYSAEALLLAYNQVHQIADGGDKYLSEIAWEPKPDTALFE
jgi:hypothetical protein